MYPFLIQKAIDAFSKFPTVGRRSASRFAFYITKLSANEYGELVKSMNDLRNNIRFCNFCFNPYDGSSIASQNSSLCPICLSNNRDKSIVAIVEKENDLITIENTKRYKGLYFIIGGTVSRLKKEDLEKLRIAQLEERIKNPANFIPNCQSIKEIIIATNPTVEGESTGLLLERKIAAIQMPNNNQIPKITHLAKGLPVGAELEYADEETLFSAFEGRH
jgi:recombination protein RecR